MAKWNDGNATPNERGWYLRDYRAMQAKYKSLPPFSVDLWEPDPDIHSILYPGVWYVMDGVGLNDAARRWSSPERRLRRVRWSDQGKGRE